MSDSDLDTESPPFVEIRPDRQIVVMAELDDREFAQAQGVMPDLNEYLNHDDWLDYRQGFQLGQAMAGVDVRMVPVALSPFLIWCRLAQKKPSRHALDAFAVIVFKLRQAPNPVGLALVDEGAFRAHSGVVEAFASHKDFQEWARHRAAVRTDIVAAGARTELLPVRVEDFVEWSHCLGGDTSESSLDRYTALILEFLTQETATVANLNSYAA
jgi:hypothetical protein